METTPQLAPPGAGLPFLQSLVVRYYFGPFVAAKSKWDQNLADFISINDKILKAVEGLSPEQLSTPVLVPPQRGIEDSSRFWSVAMTLEHLVIVGTKVRELIVLLSQEKIVEEKVEIAKVKPLGKIPPQEALRTFREFVQTLPGELKKRVKNPDAKARHYHPWFGKMPAKQWQWLLASHSLIHYKQIKNILKGLPS